MTDAPSAGTPNSPNPHADGVGSAASAWTVGTWHVDAATGELRRGDESHRLEPKVVEVLGFLARRAGQVVGREELLSAVWPGVVVGDDALTQAIIKLRKALGDDAKHPAYIETLSKRGYRLIAPVTQAPAVRRGGVDAAPSAPDLVPAPPTSAPAAPARTRTMRWRLAALGGALAAAVVATVLALGVHRGASDDGSDAVRAAPERLPVIAVLPLANHSGDPAREFFSDGLTDDVIHALGRYSSLRVISRNSVQQFKQREASPKAIAGELGARYLVTGSVREADDRVRVAVELSDAQSARVLWSQHFDGQGSEVFRLQDSVAQNIVGALALKVTRLESERAAQRPPAQREAYDLVLLARSLELKSDRAANRQARALVAQARQLAPDYAMAYVVESDLEVQRADQGWMEDPAQGLMRAERAARHALTFDDPGASARAHAKLARIHTFRGEHAQALAESERARALNPSDISIAEARAEALLWAGRSSEAVALLEGALRLEPVGRRSGQRNVITLAYFAAERYVDALAASERGLAEHPELPVLHAMRAASLAQLGRPEEAQRSAAEVLRLQPNFPVADFGNRFADPAVRNRLQAALRTAGL